MAPRLYIIILFENDSGSADSVVITQASATNCTNYTVAYYDNTAADRTSAVTGAGATISSLASGAGTTWSLRVTPSASINGSTPPPAWSP